MSHMATLPREERGVSSIIAFIIIMGLFMFFFWGVLLQEEVPIDWEEEEYKTMTSVKASFMSLRSRIQNLDPGQASTTKVKTGTQAPTAILNVVGARYVSDAEEMYYYDDYSQGGRYLHTYVSEANPTLNYRSGIHDFFYEASTDKWAYQGLGGNDAPPADNTSGLEITDYDNIERSDGVRIVNSSAGTVNSNPFHRFQFTISEDPENITELGYRWEGHAGGNNAALYIWWDNAGSWEWRKLGNHDNPWDSTISGTIRSNIENFIGGSTVNLCAVNLTNDGDWIYTDYVYVKVGPDYDDNNLYISTTENRRMRTYLKFDLSDTGIYNRYEYEFYDDVEIHNVQLLLYCSEWMSPPM